MYGKLKDKVVLAALESLQHICLGHPVPAKDQVAAMQDDAAEAEWFDVSQPPSKLAFDHKLIIRTAFEHLLKQHTGKGENCGVHIDFCRYAVVDISRTFSFSGICMKDVLQCQAIQLLSVIHTTWHRHSPPELFEMLQGILQTV